MSGGERIAVATREAVLGDDLTHMESEVLKAFRDKTGAEESARAESARLQLAAVRRIFEHLRPERGAGRSPSIGLAARRPRT
jgi:F-type H+-transporting ATPase subunit epsilon